MINYRIVRHFWQGAYITNDTHYYIIEKRTLSLKTILKRILFISTDWHEWQPIKDRNEPIHFTYLADAQICFLRLISGNDIGNWREEIIY